MTYLHSSLSLVAVLITAFTVAAGCATTTGTGVTGGDASSVSYASLSDTAVAATGGRFALRNMRLRIKNENARFSLSDGSLKVQIENNTDRAWSDLSFDIVARGPNGERKGTAYFKYYLDQTTDSLLYPNSTKEFNGSVTGDGVFKNPNGSENLNAHSFEVENFAGRFPTTYGYSMSEPKSSQELIFENENFDIGFAVNRKRIGFQLRNKSSEPITIDWNQISYVDPSGSSHKVMHQGVKYSNRDQPLAPTTVPPNASIEDIVLPTDYVRYNGGANEWTTDPLFPSGTDAEAYEGRSFSVFMPLEIGGETQNYNFVFSIDDVSPVTSRN